jgi:hypothetical protein
MRTRGVFFFHLIGEDLKKRKRTFEKKDGEVSILGTSAAKNL